jgi:hypothetical protein
LEEQVAGGAGCRPSVVQASRAGAGRRGVSRDPLVGSPPHRVGEELGGRGGGGAWRWAAATAIGVKEGARGREREEKRNERERKRGSGGGHAGAG